MKSRKTVSIIPLLQGAPDRDQAKRKGPAKRRLVKVWTIRRVWWRGGSGTRLVSETAGWENQLFAFSDGEWRRVYHV